jgi:23S rRNA pseudouridine955/2504/2580 synthase
VKNIEILHEDDFSIAVNKPAGLAVQGGKGVKTSLDALLAENHKGGIETKPLLVHRLDKDTSGVILAAKGRAAAARFSHLLSKKAVKVYIAVCKGRPEKSKGIITESLNVHGGLKHSETKYKVIKTGVFLEFIPTSTGSVTDMGEFSVLEIELGTGRMHQIRRHLAMTGNPILGDDKYGDFSLNKNLRKTANVKRMLLHASNLIIKNEPELNINAQLPEYFNVFLQR